MAWRDRAASEGKRTREKEIRRKEKAPNQSARADV